MTAAAVVLVINAGNLLDDPAPVRCEPGDRLAFVVFNLDNVDHKVWIDPAAIVLKSDKTVSANPLVTGKHVLHVKAGDVEMLKQTVKAKAAFGGTSAGQLPYTTYKYTVTSADANGNNPVDFDPDIDVCPPS